MPIVYQIYFILSKALLRRDSNFLAVTARRANKNTTTAKAIRIVVETTKTPIIIKVKPRSIKPISTAEIAFHTFEIIPILFEGVIFKTSHC